MMRCDELRRLAFVVRRVERAALCGSLRARVACHRRDDIDAQCERADREVESLRAALGKMYTEPQNIDCRQLHALLHRAAKIRGLWREALAQIRLLEIERERARSDAAAALTQAHALRARAERLNTRMKALRVGMERRRLKTATHEIEEQAWTQLLA